MDDGWWKDGTHSKKIMDLDEKCRHAKGTFIYEYVQFGADVD